MNYLQDQKHNDEVQETREDSKRKRQVAPEEDIPRKSSKKTKHLETHGYLHQEN